MGAVHNQRLFSTCDARCFCTLFNVICIMRFFWTVMGEGNITFVFVWASDIITSHSSLPSLNGFLTCTSWWIFRWLSQFFWFFLSVPISTMALWLKNFRCLGLPSILVLCLHFREFNSLCVDSPSLSHGLERSSKLGQSIIGLTSFPISQRSLSFHVWHLVSSKTLFHMFCTFFGCFRLVHKSGHCYFSLIQSEGTPIFLYMLFIKQLFCWSVSYSLVISPYL